MVVYAKPTMTADEFKAAAAVMTAQQLGELAGLSTRTVQKLAQEGKLPGVKVGGKWCFSRDKIAAMLGID